MPQTFIDNDRLATLSELRYLLLEVLDREEPVSSHDLAVLCKERSLNFAFAYENTMRFLKRISVLREDSDKWIRISSYELNAGLNDKDLSALLFQRTCDHLEREEILKKVFSDEVLSFHEDEAIVSIRKLPLGFDFIKSLLLNIKIANPLGSFDAMIIVGQFKSILRSKVFKRESHEIQSSSSEKKSSQKTDLYISYSQKDRDYMVKLKDHFSGLVLNEIIESHDDDSILPGDDWDKRNKEMLQRSQVILFLISSNLLASKYINQIEIPMALDRLEKGHAKIIPVMLHACDFSSLPISKYQAVPVGGKAISDWPNENQAFLNVVEQIKRIL